MAINRKTISMLFTLLVVSIALILLFILPDQSPKTTSIRGIVTNHTGPVAGAVVRVRGTTRYVRSDAEGRFELTGRNSDDPEIITAWAPGYFITGTEQPVDPGTDGITLTLHAHPTEDATDYEFISPFDLDNHGACGHCHVEREEVDFTFPVDEWVLDAHSTSATNPRFLSLYNGTTLAGDPGTPTEMRYDNDIGVNLPVSPSLGMDTVGPGFRLDFPDQAGNCAPCHVPVAALDSPFNTDPNHAEGVAAEGVTCDFCHKVWDVRLQANGLPSPALPGTLSMEFLRPPEGEQVFVGQFDDVVGEDIFSPFVDQSAFCAGCHFGEFWGVIIYNSFGEWLESPYSNPETGQTCQDCHMPRSNATAFAQLPPDSEMQPPPVRDPDTVFSHLMPGAIDETLLQNTATVTIDAQRLENRLQVIVQVTNTGAGHHIPTDNPLRNMILLVKATDADGETLPLLDGPIIPEWGGVGDVETGHVAGLPGVLYAKILADFYTGETPTFAYWRQTRLVSDNRIAALETDETLYSFALPEGNGTITIDAQLLLRRAFIDLMDVKDWDTPDMLMAHVSETVDD
jgi:hypothetical protein